MQSVTGPGQVVAGRYELLNMVGHGAMGTVWRARDLLLARDVAVKEMRLPGLMAPQDRAVARERSLREARVAARLTHPGVVTVHDVIEAGGVPWIVMEFVSARSLAQVLAEDGPMTPAGAAGIGMVLLDALRGAHAAGIVHRDVKPGNVLVTEGGRAVLTDFGIATVAGDPALTQAGMVMGTPGFCAPERIRGEPASPASDLWSLGATLYAAVEGRGPFDGQGSAMAVLADIVNRDPPPAASAGSLGQVIAALMSRDPAARPGAAAARRMLAQACDGAPAGPAAQARPAAGTAGPTLVFPAAESRTETTTAQGAPVEHGPPSQAGPSQAGPSQAGPPQAGSPQAGPPPAAGPQAGPPQAGPFQAGPVQVGPAQRRPGRHRRGLLLGGGGAALALIAFLVAAAAAHAARLQAIRHTAATTPGLVLPAGYHWYTRQPSASPRQAGYSVAVPDGWRTRERGGTTRVRDPRTGGSMTFTVARPGGPGPVREAQALASAESRGGPLPGYYKIAVLPVPFHGTLAGAWRYAYTRPGSGQVQALELVTQLNTSSGAQPYDLAVAAPLAGWAASKAAFDEALASFTPQP